MLQPDWINKENGLWVFDEIKSCRYVLSNFLKNWLEDAIPEDLYIKMGETTKLYSEEKEYNEIISFFDTLVKSMIEDFENSINKLSPMGVNS